MAIIQGALKDTLRFMVHQYGFEEVDRSLREIKLADSQLESSGQSEELLNKVVLARAASQRAKPTAPVYVAKMELPADTVAAVSELAQRFEDKAFLPSFGDVANFCRIYGIDEPASRSRASAIPRVFKFMATMQPDELQGILDDGMFSGPARLGPIADAIRRNGRANAV